MLDHNLTKREEKFFKVAKAVAKTSTFHRNHLGCCIVYKGVVVSVGCNSERSHPLQKEYNKRYKNFDTDVYPNKLHAEVHALSLLLSSKKDIDWSKTSLYIYRELKNGKPAFSYPCSACSQLIRDLGISTIYYVNEQGEYTKEKIITFKEK